MICISAAKLRRLFQLQNENASKEKGSGKKERENSIRCESSCPAAITTPLSVVPFDPTINCQLAWRGVPCLMKLSELSLTLLITHNQLQPPLTNCLDDPRLRLAATSAAVSLPTLQCPKGCSIPIPPSLSVPGLVHS